LAKHPAKCPKCGGRLEYESAVDEEITCPQCRALLSVPGKIKPSDKVDPLIGQALGEFEVVELLGRGGMGAVYKARQPSLDRFVAVKVLPRSLARDASFVERFTREARDAAAISHPNIIQVFAVGQEKGFQYIAMEFVEGESLADVLKREGRLAPERALDLFKQVTAALGVAHAKGIVHRDIKPANIMVTVHGHAKLADFGLAKRTATDVTVTQTGALMGTPLYFPPEAARSERYDTRSDLYSLGATFYHLIAGRPPFEGDNAMMLALKHSNDPVPPLKEAAPSAPAALCSIIHRLLHKDAAERFQSADELLAALNHLPVGGASVVGGVSSRRVSSRDGDVPPTYAQAGAPVPHKVSLDERRAAKAWSRKKLVLIAGGAAAAILLVVVLVLALRPGPREAVTHVAQPPSAVSPASLTPKTDNRTPTTALPTPPKPPPPKPTPEPKKEEPPAKKEPGPPQPTPEPKAKEPVPPPEADAEAKWNDLRDRVGKLAAAGDYDGAAKLLDSATEIKLKDIAERITEAREEVAAARRVAVARAEAAYAVQSDKVWALFKERKYDEADKLLANLPKVPNLREVMAADQEASRLLRDFWAAVEASLAAKKGRFLAFGGAGGAIAEVKEGNVTLRSGRAEVTLPIIKLTAKQALAYAEIKDDERSNLMTAVVLLADGVALDEAGQALDRAGDAPSVAIYRQRLEALQLGAAEAAAKAAWGRIEEEAKGKLSPGTAKRLTDMLAAFEKAHGGTKLYKGLGEQIAAVKTRIEDSLGYTKWPFDEKEAKRRQKATADALGVKVEEEIDLGNGVKMTLVLIPAGEFLMGSPPTTSPEQLVKVFGGNLDEFQREFPQHRVKISKPFWLGKTEVTQAQWEAVMGDNPSQFKPRPQNPVEMVSWNDCQGFLQKLSAKCKRPFRLPTEGEWEYACRAGTPTEFSFGDSQAALPQHAWLNANSSASTQPVGKAKPNAWGLHDMLGNVWEWCEDWFAPYDKAAQVDPKGPEAGGARVLRGGSWCSKPRDCRSAPRYMRVPTSRFYYLGCRVCVVARTLK